MQCGPKGATKWQKSVLNQKSFKNPCPKNRGFYYKKSVVLVKRKNGFTRTILAQKTLEKNKEKSVLVIPSSRFTKTTDLFAKILGFEGKGFQMTSNERNVSLHLLLVRAGWS